MVLRAHAPPANAIRQRTPETSDLRITLRVAAGPAAGVAQSQSTMSARSCVLAMNSAIDISPSATS